MAREHMFFTYAEAPNHGAYAEHPVLPDDTDLQLHLSRNDRPQPFFLICEHDTVLVVMSGAGRVHFHDGPVRYHTYETGDFIYVPAGMPHRIVPSEESIHYRYKLPESELEAVAWFCAGCGTEIHRDTWELAGEELQASYLRACTEFNDDTAARTCASCGSVHPVADLTGIQWEATGTDRP